MNTEFKIPPPSLTYRHRESLKQEEPTDLPWLTMATVAASISLLLGIYMLLEPTAVSEVPSTQYSSIDNMPTNTTDTTGRDTQSTVTTVAQTQTTSPNRNIPQAVVTEQPEFYYPSITETESVTITSQRAQLPDTKVVDQPLTMITPNLTVDLQPLTMTIMAEATNRYSTEELPKKGPIKDMLQRIPVMIADLGESIVTPFRNLKNNNQ